MNPARHTRMFSWSYRSLAVGCGMAATLSGLTTLVVSGQQVPSTSPAAPAAGRGAPQGAPAPQLPAEGGRGARGAGGGGRGTIVQGPNGEVWGYSDSAFNAGSRWRVHDPNRPQPPVVETNGAVTVAP